MASSSEENEVFSEDEVGADQTYVKQKFSLTEETNDKLSGDEEIVESEGEPSSKTKSSLLAHPSYLVMVQEAIVELTSGSGRQSGVSKTKISDHMKTKYGLVEVNNLHVKKALKSAVEKNIIENTTGTGASGSFKVTKTFKEQLKKADKKKDKPVTKKEDKPVTKKENNKTTETQSKNSNTSNDSSTAAKSKKKEDLAKSGKSASNKQDKKTESKPAAAKRKTTKKPDDTEHFEPTTKKKALKGKSEGTEDGGEKGEKKVTKKPPVAKSKENKDAKKATASGNGIKEKKILKEKSSSTGSIKKATTKNEKNDLPGPNLDVEMPRKRGKKAAAR